MSLANIAAQIGRTLKKTEVVNIIDFVEASWGLSLKLYPVQKIILKAHYGLQLDDNIHDFDLSKKIPSDHLFYKEFAILSGPGKGFYKHRVPVSTWRRDQIEYISETDYLKRLYAEGRSNIKYVTPREERREMILSIGRRSGKTLLAGCISAYETYKLLCKHDPQRYYGLPSSNVIQLISVATDKDQAGLLYNEVSGHFKNCAFFEPYTANNTQSYARFQTPMDIERYGAYRDNPNANATIKITFRSCVAKGLRGAGNVVVILDEVAHFTDKGQSGAESVYNAVVPSTSAYSPKDLLDKSQPIGPVEGRIILISSPLGRQGLFYKMAQISLRGGTASENMLFIQAPTWEVNPTIPANEFEKHYLKDPGVFFTEYGGEFSDRTKGWIERSQDLLSCVSPSAKPTTRGVSRHPYFIGLDLGLAGDGTAIAIGHIDRDRKIIVDLVDQIKAGEGEYKDKDRLDFDGVADWIKKLANNFQFTEGIFDQWAGIPLEQALMKRGLRQMKSTAMTKNLVSQMFQNFKDMMYDNRIVLYDYPIPDNEDHCPYIQELLELQAEYHSKYVTTVEAPNIQGKHDDMSDALIRMVWLASNHLGNLKIMAPPRYGYGAYNSSGKGFAHSKMNPRGGSHPSRQLPRKRRK